MVIVEQRVTKCNGSWTSNYTRREKVEKAIKGRGGSTLGRPCPIPRSCARPPPLEFARVGFFFPSLSSSSLLVSLEILDSLSLGDSTISLEERDLKRAIAWKTIGHWRF